MWFIYSVTLVLLSTHSKPYVSYCLYPLERQKSPNFFLLQGHNIIVLTHNTAKLQKVRIIKSIEQINPDEKIDVIINLAGAPINKRWSDSYKELLISSRLEGTVKLTKRVYKNLCFSKLLLHADFINRVLC